MKSLRTSRGWRSKTISARYMPVIMSMNRSAKLNGHDPYRYLKDVLERLPTHTANRINELLPHC